MRDGVNSGVQHNHTRACPAQGRWAIWRGSSVRYLESAAKVATLGDDRIIAAMRRGRGERPRAIRRAFQEQNQRILRREQPNVLVEHRRLGRFACRLEPKHARGTPRIGPQR